MSDTPEPGVPVLKIDGADPRAMMYQKIAEVHRQITAAKWKARQVGRQFSLRPEILLHLEESIAFLAEEVLELRAAFESDMSELVKDGVERALGLTAEALEATKAGTPEEMVTAVAENLKKDLEEEA